MKPAKKLRQLYRKEIATLAETKAAKYFKKQRKKFYITICVQFVVIAGLIVWLVLK